MTTITLSLISHTNVGKTTLARTLLRRDIGAVLDQAHVTDMSEAHPLIETSDGLLVLWDTPGFGDTRRLMKRLRHEDDPLGWFLHRVWDRVVDRPLWCGQEAVRNIKEQADVVLYLVNAAEEPEEAGYVGLELEILSWMKRPVLLLLNQTGGGDERLEQHWGRFVERWPFVRGVLSLDAFTRCWTEESTLLVRVVELLEGPRRQTMERLVDAWNRRSLSVFKTCCDEIAGYLARAAVDHEAPGAKPEAGGTVDGWLELLTDALKFSTIDKKKAMTALNRRLDRSTQSLMERMIAEHGLEGDSAARIERRVHDFQVKGAAPFNETSGAVAGAVLTGALGGLAADVLSGGLTLGGGMIAGGILGALGGSTLARAYRWIGGDQRPSVRWTPEFLDQLTRQALLRYLAVAHFGRGRGEFQDLEQPAHWSDAVDDALRQQKTALRNIWQRGDEAAEGSLDRIESELSRIVEATARGVLRASHPRAAAIL